MKTKIALAVASSLLLSAPALAKSGTASPTVSHTNPSSCLGAERAARNSNGGDRAQGDFGQAQAAYVASLVQQGVPYGEILRLVRENCALGE